MKGSPFLLFPWQWSWGGGVVCCNSNITSSSYFRQQWTHISTKTSANFQQSWSKNKKNPGIALGENLGCPSPFFFFFFFKREALSIPFPLHTPMQLVCSHITSVQWCKERARNHFPFTSFLWTCLCVSCQDSWKKKKNNPAIFHLNFLAKLLEVSRTCLCLHCRNCLRMPSFFVGKTHLCQPYPPPTKSQKNLTHRILVKTKLILSEQRFHFFKKYPNLVHVICMTQGHLETHSQVHMAVSCTNLKESVFRIDHYFDGECKRIPGLGATLWTVGQVSSSFNPPAHFFNRHGAELPLLCGDTDLRHYHRHPKAWCPLFWLSSGDCSPCLLVISQWCVTRKHPQHKQKKSGTFCPVEKFPKPKVFLMMHCKQQETETDIVKGCPNQATLFFLIPSSKHWVCDTKVTSKVLLFLNWLGLFFWKKKKKTQQQKHPFSTLSIQRTPCIWLALRACHQVGFFANFVKFLSLWVVSSKGLIWHKFCLEWIANLEKQW